MIEPDTLGLPVAEDILSGKDGTDLLSGKIVLYSTG